MIELMPHQEYTATKWKERKRMFDHSDPGTGKTIASLTGYHASICGRLLAIAPLTILRPSWAADIDKAFPGFTWAVAHGSERKRKAAFDSGADIVLLNHDGVKWVVDNTHVLDGFSHCVVDEYTAFKNRTAARSKAMYAISGFFEYLNMLSGTPNSNKITDIWYPAMMVDGGKRLGDNFFKFQQETCEGRPVPGALSPRAKEWTEKEGARDAVAILLQDIVVRHQLKDVPANTRYTMHVDMPTSVMRAYRELERESVLMVEGSGVINAVHAGSKIRKILQLLSGAVYDVDGNVVKVHPHRYELVIELIQAREQCVVAFNYRHEREALTALARRKGIPFGVIDGAVSPGDRQAAVDQFQNNKLKVIFAHPQSAGHGLTLTEGTTTIWASPTYNAEHFQQFNARIYRKGQTKETETICICATGTKEADVYDKLDGKLTRMADLLAVFAEHTRQETA